LCLAAAATLAAGSQAAYADRRVALVIGNGAYQHTPELPNPPHDAQDVAAVLRRNGFDTILGIDLDKSGMEDVQIRFSRAARNADFALFYYSGHALQFAGINYLVPVDAKLTDEADLRRMERVDDLVADLQQAKTLRILVLDSCRDNPLAENLKRSIGKRGGSIQRGLAKIEHAEGMVVSYATQAGMTAEDGQGRNSPYTAAFLKHIEAPEEIGIVFRRISADVYAATGQQQLPELSISMIGEYYLGGTPKLPVPTSPPVPSTVLPFDPCAAAEVHWHSTQRIDLLGAYEDHLARFPTCAFAGLAKTKIEALRLLASSGRAGLHSGHAAAVGARLLFPDSDRRYLTSEELQGLSAGQLRIARNEIFARRGRLFRDQELTRYFGQFDWYKPYSWEVPLSPIEDANVKLIQSFEH
jgi:Caspase domain/YARHG domain